MDDPIPRPDQPAIAAKLDTDIVLSEAGKRRRAMPSNRVYAKVMRPCEHCLIEYGAVELRKHQPRCFLAPAKTRERKVKP